MKDSKTIPLLSRRTFVATFSTFSGAAALGCSKKPLEFTCTEVSGLSEADRTVRTTLAYADRAPNPEKECARCTQYAAADMGCGTCKIMRGPIHPNGTCKSFAAKS